MQSVLSSKENDQPTKLRSFIRGHLLPSRQKMRRLNFQHLRVGPASFGGNYTASQIQANQHTITQPGESTGEEETLRKDLINMSR
jgi:hypothetical protein